MRLVDLSHAIHHGMVTYPSLPGSDISTHLDFDESHEHYAAGTEFAIGRIDMIANTGTYLDTPAHRFRAGHDLHQLPLERCAMLPAVVVDERAVLLRTGWDQHWGTDQYGEPEHPHLNRCGGGPGTTRVRPG